MNWLIIAKEEFEFDPGSTKLEGRWRLRDPKDFDQRTFRRFKVWAGIEAPKGITLIVGTLQGEETSNKAIQSIRFDLNLWSEESAEQFWDAVKGKKGFERLWKKEDWEKEEEPVEEIVEEVMEEESWMKEAINYEPAYGDEYSTYRDYSGDVPGNQEGRSPNTWIKDMVSPYTTYDTQPSVTPFPAKDSPVNDDQPTGMEAFDDPKQVEPNYLFNCPVCTANFDVTESKGTEIMKCKECGEPLLEAISAANLHMYLVKSPELHIDKHVWDKDKESAFKQVVKWYTEHTAQTMFKYNGKEFVNVTKLLNEVLSKGELDKFVQPADMKI